MGSYKQVNYKDNNISLNDLLQQYLSVQNTKKREIQVQMKQDQLFWERRPLSQDMMDYATQDVVFLPRVFTAMQSYFTTKITQSSYHGGQFYTNKMTVFEKIMTETLKCHKYASINKHVDDPTYLPIGAII